MAALQWTGTGAAGSLVAALAHGYQPAMIALAALTGLAALIAAIFVTDQHAAAPVATPTARVSEAATP